MQPMQPMACMRPATSAVGRFQPSWAAATSGRYCHVIVPFLYLVLACAVIPMQRQPTAALSCALRHHASVSTSPLSAYSPNSAMTAWRSASHALAERILGDVPSTHPSSGHSSPCDKNRPQKDRRRNHSQWASSSDQCKENSTLCLITCSTVWTTWPQFNNPRAMQAMPHAHVTHGMTPTCTC